MTYCSPAVPEGTALQRRVLHCRGGHTSKNRSISSKRSADASWRNLCGGALVRCPIMSRQRTTVADCGSIGLHWRRPQTAIPVRCLIMSLFDTRGMRTYYLLRKENLLDHYINTTRNSLHSGTTLAPKATARNELIRHQIAWRLCRRLTGQSHVEDL